MSQRINEINNIKKIEFLKLPFLSILVVTCFFLSSSYAQSVPTSPQNLVASTSSNQINLSWNAPSNSGGDPVIGYRIDYAIDSGSFTTLTANTGNTGTTFTHNNTQLGHNYNYIVYAINSVGVGSPSNIASASTNQGTVPNPPQNLIASVTSSNQITLSWSSPTSGTTQLTGYRIDYSIDSSNFISLTSNTGSVSTTHIHTGVQPGHTYRYIVYAINSVGTSSPSNMASASINQQSNVPNPPQNLIASVISSNQINLSWNSSPDVLGTGVTGYRIDYSIDSGNFVPLVSNIGTATTYSHTGIQPGHTYRYIVYAMNSVGTSNPSNQAYATIGNPTPTVSILSGTIPVVNTPATLGYSISGGQVYSASINNDTNTLNFRLQGSSPGVLYLQLSRTLIDAKQPDGSDKTFYVVVDNKNAIFTETRTGSYRALAISFPAGASDVTIIGTSVVGGVNVMGGTVPEFPFALIGLVAGLTPAIFLSRRFVKF